MKKPKPTIFIPTQMISHHKGTNMEYTKSTKPSGLTHCMDKAVKKSQAKPKINYKKMFED